MEHFSLISHGGDVMSPYFSGPASCLLYLAYFLALFPFITLSGRGHNFEIIQWILSQLHKMIKVIEIEEDSVQEP